ncbi:MAG: PIN domain-containing protein, partial [Fusobacteriaceae bacterium]
MKKIFVLDTNILIHDPSSIYSFKESEVVLPIFVIEEIDDLKRKPST